jgi:small conductance mechanosensitive channel
MSSTNAVVINVAGHAPGTNVITINMVVPDATNSISQPATNAAAQTSDSWWLTRSLENVWGNAGHPHVIHIIIIIVLAIVVHLVATFIRNFSELLINKSHEKKYPFDFVTHQPKFVTLTRLIVSTLTFVIYALAIYIILVFEYPSVTSGAFKTYLTSAAVIGLALSFGLQGLVQDVVTGITLICSDAMDVGDTVDLMNGVIGRVERIGLRFTKVVNFYNQEIFVPNRNIINVSRFPHGGILAYVDIQIPLKVDQNAVVQAIETIAKGVQAQFNAIIFDEPAFGKIQATPGNWSYLRVRFRIWPGQNSIIENVFVQQMAATMKTFDPTYIPSQIVVTYRAMS